jgi:lauroyl/myristoyl acyltransferase
MRLCRGYLPFSIVRRVSFALTRIDWRRAIESKADQALNIVRELPELPGPLQSLKQFRRMYRRNFTWKMAEVQAIVSSTPEAVDRWMERRVHLEGKEHLDAALSLGSGVILCPFRFGCPALIPMTLIRAGYSLTQVTAPGGVPYAKEFADFQKLRPDFGSYHEVRDLSLARYRTVLTALEAGGLVVWLPDFTGPAGATSDSVQPRSAQWTEEFSAPVLRTALPKARIAVPFCGRHIFMNRWVGSFAVMAGSPVIPAALVRTGGQTRFILQPPIMPEALTGGGTCKAEAIDRMLFDGLESFVRRHPAQWLAWRHVQYAGEPAGSERAPTVQVCA